ncbi:29 kDa ribonucleoprotein a chloroplastic [Phtheirospermum japonicum]|uniref:29 kDa ribonucleoprotein a chloroplastic n=1 Tax=Phtheirospermum japonicum TaxID=374723 RepID=A0A830CUE7_9LAMI|nr:29 kDa ribonucleoprotein a chloroplastic [Phtheirospermum japonicum]
MAFGATEAITSIFPSYPSSSPKFHWSLNKPSSSSVGFHISLSAPAPSLKFTLSTLPLLSSSQPDRNPGFQLHSAVESVTVEEQVENSQKSDSRRKLFVLNLPWSYSVADIKKLFGECGTVEDVEIIKHINGKNRGFAFVTMASGEEAQAAIEKYDTYELVGRIIRVELSRRFKKPIRRDPAVGPPPGETRYKLYVSNLAWKVRSNILRDFFTSNFNPVSVRVVFDSPSGRSAGYGFVSFATKEEAESAISVLDGKELLGRPIRLKFSEKSDDATSESKEEESSEQQPRES